jgi:CubicO group peptidase (beta-lactamase class C family)
VSVRLSLSLAALILAGCSRTADQPAPPPAAATPVVAPAATATVAPSMAELDAWLTSQNAADRFSGVVLVARGDEILLRRAYGLADRSWNVPLTPTAKVQIASLTKQFTAAAILKLQDEGKLTVRDPLCRWVEPCPPEWAPVTLHHLMTHTAGIPDLLNQADYKTVHRLPATPAEQTAAAAARRLSFQPGHPLSLQQLRLQPARLRDREGVGSSLRRLPRRPPSSSRSAWPTPATSIPASSCRRWPAGYDWERGVVNPHWRDPSVIFSAGGLYSNADDLRTWTRALHAAGDLAGLLGADDRPRRAARELRPAHAQDLEPDLRLRPDARPGGPHGRAQLRRRADLAHGSWFGFRNLVSYAPARTSPWSC